MNSKTIVQNILRKKAINSSAFARQMGVSKQVMFDRLNTKERIGKDGNKYPAELNVRAFSKMCRKLGYKIVVMPSVTDTHMPEWYEVN